jgi:hypothetical protein
VLFTNREVRARMRVLITMAFVATIPACHAPVQTAAVYQVEGAEFAKGMFLVAPTSDDPRCQIQVPTATGYRVVSCSTQYVVACDATRAEGQPLCKLATESGSDRDSSYPKGSVEK